MAECWFAMTLGQAKAIIVREWLALPAEERATESQALAFAMKVADRFQFRSLGGRYQIIKGWLQRHIGLP
ncbi:hypothetical protein SAMN05444161_8661 [Rhizobiales bacterium GAS191]|nr:hypothetical protein SAMN05444161_6781 [Rhizobiales bacterium GAS191]SEF06159.1 hypothetical protein SAMN05519104_8162 [Rhizobiales bacterium GAS188]SEF11955.1 hypothetical protein SAMN05444161_8661 [Rhizobiales bacterium GAS191]